MAHHTVAAYNFWKGHPSARLLPVQEILEATQTVLANVNQNHFDGIDNTHPLNYGPDLGNLSVRSAVAAWNDSWFGPKTPTDPACINLTNGASFGLMNALLQLTSPHNGLTRKCFVVTPTYFLVNSALIDAGFAGKLEGIAELENGDIDLETLEARLAALEKDTPSNSSPGAADIPHTHDPTRPLRKIYNYVVYLVPTFSNPRGGTLSQAGRQRLLTIARKYNVLLLCDDVYDLLDFNLDHQAPLPKRIVTLDRETMADGELYGNTVSNATFSKLIGPGLRVGWQETATPQLALALSAGGAYMSGGTPAHLNTVIVLEMLRNGTVDRVIQGLRKTYGERAAVLKAAVQKYLPEGTKLWGLEGGYFGWVDLPDEYDNQAIVARAAKLGVFLAPGEKFEVLGDERGWGERGVRVSVSHLEADGIEEGVRIWGEVCTQAANKA